MPGDAHVCCGDAERLVRAADRWTGSGGTGRFPNRGRRASLVIGKAQGPRISITGLGCYVPDRVLTNDELSTIVNTSDEWIMERTVIRERRRGGAREGRPRRLPRLRTRRGRRRRNPPRASRQRLSANGGRSCQRLRADERTRGVQVRDAGPRVVGPGPARRVRCGGRGG